MKRLFALLLTLILLTGAYALGDETVTCVLTPRGLFDTVPLYNEVGGQVLGEYHAYTPVERLNLDGAWALVSIGTLTGWMEANRVTPVPNPNSMPDAFFNLTVLEDMTVNGYFLPQGTFLLWLGTTAQGNHHVAYWGNSGKQTGFVDPAQAAPSPLKGYGGAACETALYAEPKGQVLMTLLPGVRMQCQMDPDWSLVTTESGHTGYVATSDIAFSLKLTQQQADCPVVILQEEASLVTDDKTTVIASQPQGTAVAQLAQDGEWALIASWDAQFTGWVKAAQVKPSGQMRTHQTDNKLPVSALAIAAPTENSPLEPGAGLLVQGEAGDMYQTNQGFVPKADLLYIPVTKETSRLVTLSLKEGELFTWNGETFTGPGAYDIALFPDEEAPQGAESWPLGQERLSLSQREEQGSGRILGLHCYQELLDSCTLRITALPGGGVYTIRTLGGRDLRIDPCWRRKRFMKPCLPTLT